MFSLLPSFAFSLSLLSHLSVSQKWKRSTYEVSFNVCDESISASGRLSSFFSRQPHSEKKKKNSSCVLMLFHYLSWPHFCVYVKKREWEREREKRQTAHPQRGRVTLQNLKTNPGAGWERTERQRKQEEEVLPYSVYLFNSILTFALINYDTKEERAWYQQ